MKSRARPKRHAALRKCAHTAHVDSRSPQKRTRGRARQEQVPNSKIAEHAFPLAVQASIARPTPHPKRKPKQAIQNGNQSKFRRTRQRGKGYARVQTHVSETAHHSIYRQVRRLDGMRQHAAKTGNPRPEVLPPWCAGPTRSTPPPTHIATLRSAQPRSEQAARPTRNPLPQRKSAPRDLVARGTSYRWATRPVMSTQASARCN